MDLADVFVFIDESDINYVKEFTDHYLSGFLPMESYFEYPKYGSETIFETESYEDILNFVFAKPRRSYTFYLSNKEHPQYQQAIIQINKDGSLCLCLSADPVFEETIYSELKSKYLDSKVFVSYNRALPDSILEIKALNNRA